MKPSNANTQCATGKYTTVPHRTRNTTQLQNFARSAIAPEIRAGVMIANISWNIAKASTGSASAPGHGFSSVPNPASLPAPSVSPAQSRLPNRPPPTSLPKERLKPNNAHSTVITASEMKFNINMLSTLFERTMPP
jgi:hypothetical protein